VRTRGALIRSVRILEVGPIRVVLATLQVALCALLLFTIWVLDDCCTGAAFPVSVAVFAGLATVVFLWNFVAAMGLLRRLRRGLFHHGGMAAHTTALRSAVPPSVVGVCALWFSKLMEWDACSKVGWSMFALGLVHLVGGVAVNVSVLFWTPRNQGVVNNVAFVCAVMCVCCATPCVGKFF